MSVIAAYLDLDQPSFGEPKHHLRHHLQPVGERRYGIYNSRSISFGNRSDLLNCAHRVRGYATELSAISGPRRAACVSRLEDLHDLRCLARINGIAAQPVVREVGDPRRIECPLKYSRSEEGL